jgi:hypothetical protein
MDDSQNNFEFRDTRYDEKLEHLKSHLNDFIEVDHDGLMRHL